MLGTLSAPTAPCLALTSIFRPFSRVLSFLSPWLLLRGSFSLPLLLYVDGLLLGSYLRTSMLENPPLARPFARPSPLPSFVY